MESKQPPAKPLFLAPDLQVPHMTQVEDTEATAVPTESSQKPEPVMSKEEVTEAVAALIARAVERRDELGLTQYDIRDLTGIPQGRVSSLERGEHMPLADSLIRYLAGTGGRLAIEFDAPPNIPRRSKSKRSK